MQQKILIVDDSIPQHNLVRVALAELPSTELHSVYSGAPALAMASSHKLDLILLDVDMPEMNGFEVCRLLKANPATAEIPVIFLTSLSSIDEKICGFDLQAIDYITKPYDPAELYVRVRVALRTKRLLDLLPRPTPSTGQIKDGRCLIAELPVA